MGRIFGRTRKRKEVRSYADYDSSGKQTGFGHSSTSHTDPVAGIPVRWFGYLITFVAVWFFTFMLVGNPLQSVGWLFGVHPMMVIALIGLASLIMSVMLISVFSGGSRK